MARPKKSTISRKKNLAQAKNRTPEYSRRATVEEVPDEDVQDLDSCPGLDDLDDCESSSESGCSDDSDLESEIGLMDRHEDEAGELESEAALAAFTSFLQQAQVAAVAAEDRRVKEGGRKKRGPYHGNAPRTKRYRAQKARETRAVLAKSGQQFISQWVRAVSESDSEEESVDNAPPAPPEVSGHGVNSESEVLSSAFPQRSDKSETHPRARSLFDEASLASFGGPEASTRPSTGHASVASSHTPSQPHPPIPEGPLSAAHIRELLESISRAQLPTDTTPDDDTDQLLNKYSLQDVPKLRRAAAALTVKSKDKTLDVFFRSRITAMLGTLNLWLDSRLTYTWRQSSLVVAISLGRGVNHARNIRAWLHHYLQTSHLPLHRYGRFHSSMLSDEDFASDLQLYLMEISKKEGHLRAQDVVDYVATPEVQERLVGGNGGNPVTISVRTGRRWLKKLSWRYTRVQKGMYIDGHEREDVVEYRKGFVQRWKEYEKRMVTFDGDGNPIQPRGGFAVEQVGRFKLVLVTHDESTFYANDRRKTKWTHASEKAVPQPKGEGSSIMVSDFLVPEWGRLKDGDDEARIIFKAGKNRDGYFDCDDLVRQVETAIDIFEARTNGFATALFLFDNASSHQKRPSDGLSARKMPKGPHQTWTARNSGIKMRAGVNPLTGEPQDLYWPDDHPRMPGWFKGMEQIIRERGLWPEKGLRAECEGFKCAPGRTDCCCRRLLFNQPDFTNQKSRLEEYVTSRGHLCDFYPKYHCELNFIEQYWGAAKAQYRDTQRTSTIEAMEENMITCLDKIPLVQIKRYANRAARFIHAYENGLTGAQAAWANRRYHGHRTLPPEMLEKARAAAV